jgi:hypothetical protein
MENSQRYPKPGEKWKHYKGGEYEIVCMCNHTDTDEVLVVYRSFSFGGFHARPFSEWNDVIGVPDPTRITVYRFTKITY